MTASALNLDQALSTMALTGNGRVIQADDNWAQDGPRRLRGSVLCEFPGAIARCRLGVDLELDANNRVSAAIVRDPLFGSAIGRFVANGAFCAPDFTVPAPPLPDSELTSDGLWHDRAAGLMWYPSQFGKGNYTFESAERLPRSLAKRSGFKGFSDWRIPAPEEYIALNRSIKELGLTASDGPLCDTGLANLMKTHLTVWTSKKVDDNSGAVFQFGGGHVTEANLPCVYPVLLVRDAM